MDIKTKIENDPVLFKNMVNLKSKGQFLRYFEQIGVSTVEDFLKLNECDYPKPSRYVYLAMSHIFRHAYLNQEFVYDVILEKIYSGEEDENYELAINDIYRLGLIKLDFYKKPLVKKLKEAVTDPRFSMYYIIKNNPGNILRDNTYSIRNYYIKYMELKEELEIKDLKKNRKMYEFLEEVEDNDEISSLNELKMQLQILNDLSKNLDQQIESLQVKINEMEGKKVSNGRE